MTDEQSQRLEGRLDKLDDRLFSMSEILAKNTEQLKIHIEGVKLAREQNDILRKDVDTRFADVRAEMAPMLQRRLLVDSLFKFLGKTSTVLGSIYAFVKIWELFKH